MFCKCCKMPIENCIEGELICTSCWDMSQEDVSGGFLQEIANFEKKTKRDDKFRALLQNQNIYLDFVDGYGCQVGGLWFDAEVYLGDLSEMSDHQIAKELAENIKATLAEIV